MCRTAGTHHAAHHSEPDSLRERHARALESPRGCAGSKSDQEEVGRIAHQARARGLSSVQHGVQHRPSFMTENDLVRPAAMQDTEVRLSL
jgi:hypothetical protein